MSPNGSVYKLFKDHPERWTKTVVARDSQGAACLADSKEAVCWCLQGAILKEYQVNIMKNYAQAIPIFDRVRDVLSKKFPERSSRYRCMIRFNDNPDTTFDQMLSVVKESGI